MFGGSYLHISPTVLSLKRFRLITVLLLAAGSSDGLRIYPSKIWKSNKKVLMISIERKECTWLESITIAQPS